MPVVAKSLYRRLIRTARKFDGENRWRRALLVHATSLRPHLSNGVKYFLDTHPLATAHAVRAAFKQATDEHSAPAAVDKAFECWHVLRRYSRFENFLERSWDSDLTDQERAQFSPPEAAELEMEDELMANLLMESDEDEDDFDRARLPEEHIRELLLQSPCKATAKAVRNFVPDPRLARFPRAVQQDLRATRNPNLDRASCVLLINLGVREHNIALVLDVLRHMHARGMEHIRAAEIKLVESSEESADSVDDLLLDADAEDAAVAAAAAAAAARDAAGGVEGGHSDELDGWGDGGREAEQPARMDRHVLSVLADFCCTGADKDPVASAVAMYALGESSWGRRWPEVQGDAAAAAPAAAADLWRTGLEPRAEAEQQQQQQEEERESSSGAAVGEGVVEQTEADIENLVADADIMESAIRAAAYAGDTKLCFALYRIMREAHVAPTTDSIESLAYASFAAGKDPSSRLLDELQDNNLPLFRQLYNTLLSCSLQHGFAAALAMVRRMRDEEDMHPDQESLEVFFGSMLRNSHGSVLGDEGTASPTVGFAPPKHWGAEDVQACAEFLQQFEEADVDNALERWGQRVAGIDLKAARGSAVDPLGDPDAE